MSITFGSPSHSVYFRLYCYETKISQFLAILSVRVWLEPNTVHTTHFMFAHNLSELLLILHNRIQVMHKPLKKWHLLSYRGRAVIVENDVSWTIDRCTLILAYLLIAETAKQKHILLVFLNSMLLSYKK